MDKMRALVGASVVSGVIIMIKRYIIGRNT